MEESWSSPILVPRAWWKRDPTAGHAGSTFRTRRAPTTQRG